MISLDNDSVSVAEYFKQQFPALPCLWVGSRDRSTYIPAEFCSMTSQPLQRMKKLADDTVANMIKQKAVKYKDPFANEFGISVADEVRILMTSPCLTPSSR